MSALSLLSNAGKFGRNSVSESTLPPKNLEQFMQSCTATDYLLSERMDRGWMMDGQLGI